MNKKIAKKIVNNIINDLNGRRGCGIDDCDASVQKEIKNVWIKLAKAEIDKYTKSKTKTKRCPKCDGSGINTVIDMHSTITSSCSLCKGKKTVEVQQFTFQSIV